MTRQLEITQPFNLEISLTMGQAFRWRCLGDGWFSGVIGENLIHIGQPDGVDGPVTYRIGGPNGERPATDTDDAMLRRYFREDDDVAAIYASIARDPKLDTIMQEFPGLRLLRQDPWECLMSYLCTANTKVPGTAKKVEAVAKSLGLSLSLPEETRYAFPAPEQVAEAGEGYLRELGVGKPSIYIVKAANAILFSGFAPDSLATVEYLDAKDILTNYPGIGDKIADCTCLFSLDQLEAFPIDIWVWRAITEAYPEWGFPEKAELSGKNYRNASDQARHVFGKYAGYANQYLFYWRRRLGEKPLTFAHRLHGKFRLPPGKTVDDLRYEYLAEKYLS